MARPAAWLDEMLHCSRSIPETRDIDGAKDCLFLLVYIRDRLEKNPMTPIGTRVIGENKKQEKE